MCSPMSTDLGDLQFDKGNFFKNCGPMLNDPLFNESMDMDLDVLPKQEPNSLSEPLDFDEAYFQDGFLSELPLDFDYQNLNVLDEATNSINLDNNSCTFSDDPSSAQYHPNYSSPDLGAAVSDSTDAASEVSSTSDLGSMSSGDSSPERLQQELMDFSPSHSLPKSVQSSETLKDFGTSNILTAGDNKTKIKLETVHTNGQSVRSVSSKSPATSPSNIQTIVLNQGNKQPFLRSGTLLKTTNKGSSVYYPCQIVKHLGQGQTIKLISSPNGNTNQLKNGIRTLTVRTSPQNGGSRSIVNKSVDGRPILKVGPTLVGNQTHKIVSSTVTVKDEPILCDADDDDSPKNGQKLELTEEEKRLLKKEHITLPSCYPLTKHQERDLKRIRRKIRNKISAQDSRKRKKEYVDGLEDKVKSCSDENQKLQKRIRYLESENETLVAHLKKYQEIVDSGNNSGRPHGQTSTALMILILSAAFVIVPNLRPKDVMDRDLAKSLDEPLPGKNRNLLGSAVALVKKEPSVDKLKQLNLDEKDFNPLSEHDYAPLAKRPRLSSSSATPFHDFIPKVDKAVSGKAAEPPDPNAGGESVSAFLGAMLDTLNRNWNDSRQESRLHTPLDRATQSLVLSLHNGKMRDDIELE